LTAICSPAGELHQKELAKFKCKDQSDSHLLPFWHTGM
jgi:hypothetical protein